MKELKPAFLMTLLFTCLTGVLFPLTIWALAGTLFPSQATGSLLHDSAGKLLGSRLIGQSFSSDKYFHTRPSAAGAGYDSTSSGGTNLGPTSKKLIVGIEDAPETTEVDETYLGVTDLVKAYRKTNNIPESVKLPADAVTRSASGLDPEISIANARLQVPRIAETRSIPSDMVDKLIEAQTLGRYLGIFGEPRVNVLNLNLALDEFSSK